MKGFNTVDMDDIYVSEENTILEAMQQLDKSAKKVLLVQNNRKLLATLTDGDVRRWILKMGSLDATVKDVANYNPVYLYEEQASTALRVMDEYSIDAVPIINQSRIIKDIIFRKPSEKKTTVFGEKIPVVIMAGGLGARLSPYTNILPKPLIPVGDYPITEHIINRFCAYGCRQFYMIVNYKRNMIKAYFDDLHKNYQVEFIIEEKKLGTGGGLSLLKDKIKSTFILTNCDILIDEDLSKAYRQHIESGNIITIVCSLKNFVIPYGIVNIGEDGIVKAVQEKPQISLFTNTGCYFVESEVIENLNYNEAVDFPQIIEKYIEMGQRVGVFPIGEEAWLDMGQMDELEKMKRKLEC